MPELPEVETVCNSLKPHLTGRMFKNVSIMNKQLRYPVSKNDLQSILNSKILQLKGRAKYIIIVFENQKALIIHLGVTGKCLITKQNVKLKKHEHIEFLMDNNMSFKYDDVRRFGSLSVFEIPDKDKLPVFFNNHGPEPLGPSFTLKYLMATCKNRKKPIKNHIMDSKVVVGIGNIYASEALFHAGIHPESKASSITTSKAKKLIDAIQTVLNDAIKAGGTTIKDYRSPDGNEGFFNRKLFVYGRSNEHCYQCKSKIHNKKLAGRSTFYCSNCQKMSK